MNEKNSNEPNIGAVLNEKDKNKQKEMYNKYVENMTPKSNGFMNCLKAFIVGGAICLLGEILNNVYASFGNDKEISALYTTITDTKMKTPEPATHRYPNSRQRLYRPKARRIQFLIPPTRGTPIRHLLRTAVRTNSFRLRMKHLKIPPTSLWSTMNAPIRNPA